MALVKPDKGTPITTSNLGSNKPPVCHTCKERKTGVFTFDSYGKPQCGDCARAEGRPIP